MANIQIPDGFVLLARYDERVGDEHKSGPKGDYAKLLRELSKDSPCIAAYKDGGQWVARKADIEEFLRDVRRRDEAPRSKPHKSAKAGRDCVAIDGRQARALFGLLGRIADALENLATRPDTDDHTPFGQHLHASTNGDR